MAAISPSAPEIDTAVPAIEAAAITHLYGSRRALNRVSFQIAPGEVFGFLGPNGGGKSTLFRILSTMMTPTEGKALLAGFDPAGKLHEVRKRLGVVFQSPSLDPLLTVAESMRHQGRLYGLHGKELKNRTEELLTGLSLADRSRDRVSKLSGGLRRRVEIAKSLLHRPRILILDEPSTGLDPGARLEMWKLLRSLRREEEVTVVFTTHLMEEAEIADRLAILDQGNLVAMDTPDGLKSRVGGDVIALESDDPEDLAGIIRDKFQMEPAVVDHQVRLERERGHEFVPVLVEALPGKLKSVSVGKPTLEDVFIHLTGRGLTEAEESAE